MHYSHYRWIIFLSAMTLTFTKYLVEVSYGQFLTSFTQSFPTSTMAMLQWTGSMVSAIDCMFVWVVLRFISLFGFKWSMCTGIVLSTMGLILASGCTNEFQLLVSYGVLFGLGGVCVTNTGLFLVASNFPTGDKYHIFATGCKMSIYSLAVTAVPLSNWLQVTWDWRIAYIIYAVVIAILGVVAVSIFGKYKENQDGGHGNDTDKNLILPKHVKIKMGISFTVMVIRSLCIAFFLNIPVYLLPKHSLELGFTPEEASAFVSYFGMTECFARITISLIGDRFLKNKLLYMFTVFYVAGALVNSLLGYRATTYSALMGYSVSMGAITGAMASTLYAACGEVFCGLYINEIYSAVNFAFGITFTIAMLTNGIIFDMTHSFATVFIVMSVMQLLAALLTAITNSYKETSSHS